MQLSFFVFFFKGSNSRSIKNTSGIFAANQMTGHQISLNSCNTTLIAEKGDKESTVFNSRQNGDASICYQSTSC